MRKKFLNKSKGKIQFGAGNTVGPGEVIELDEELVEKKKQAIESLIATGQLVEGTKDKDAPKEPEEPEEKPKGKGEKK